MKNVWVLPFFLFATSSFAEVNLVLIGGPGSGKGTLGLRLAARYGLVHVSAGDILREQVRLETPLGERARGLMAKGELFPDTAEALAPLVQIIGETLGAHPGGFVIEGFSRNAFRAHAFDALMNAIGRRLTGAIVIDVSRETLFNRLAHRTVCPSCQRSFNVGAYAPRKPNVCDDCHGPLVRRDDDHPEVIARRIEVYESNVGPVLRWYDEAGQLVRLDGERLEDSCDALYGWLDDCAKNLVSVRPGSA